MANVFLSQMRYTMRDRRFWINFYGDYSSIQNTEEKKKKKKSISSLAKVANDRVFLSLVFIIIVRFVFKCRLFGVSRILAFGNVYSNANDMPGIWSVSSLFEAIESNGTQTVFVCFGFVFCFCFVFCFRFG